MEQNIDEFSIVILAKDNNPSLLNRDFLGMNDIVPAEFNNKVDEGQLLSSQAYSRVAFNNNFTIEADYSRIKFVDHNTAIQVGESLLSKITQKYVQTLKHVKYSAIGVNFKSVIPKDNPGEFIKDTFFDKNLLGRLSHLAISAEMTLTFEIGNCKLNFSAKPAKLRKNTSINVILLEGNFHREIVAYPAVKEIEEALGQINKDCESFLEIFNALKIRGE